MRPFSFFSSRRLTFDAICQSCFTLFHFRVATDSVIETPVVGGIQYSVLGWGSEDPTFTADATRRDAK